jgi:hypothetical protein
MRRDERGMKVAWEWTMIKVLMMGNSSLGVLGVVWDMIPVWSASTPSKRAFGLTGTE